MNTHKTRYYREPIRPSITPNSELSLDLPDLAHAHMREAGLTGGPSSPFVSMFDSFITSDSMLTWRGNGPGVGRELRRSYSNIHGRTFARAYLEKYEGVKELWPIEGNPCKSMYPVVVRLRDGEKGDMPDWIGINADEYIVAEAKGTYDVLKWENACWKKGRSLPQCLKKGQEQVARVQIDPYRYGPSDIKFKGWTVASRWATEENVLDPWLVAIDSKQGSEPVNIEIFQESAARLQRLVLIKMISAFGFIGGSLIHDIWRIPAWDLAMDLDSFFRGFDIDRQFSKRLVLSDEREICGLSAAYFDGTFFPINNDEEITALGNLFPENRFLWIATILEESLNAARKGEFLSNHEMERSDEFLCRNGLAVANLRKVRTVRDI